MDLFTLAAEFVVNGDVVMHDDAEIEAILATIATKLQAYDEMEREATVA
jgi:hypothetical protein